MNNTLEIKKENALKAFNEADQIGKQLLTSLFGKEAFLQKITDRIKTYDDACKEVGRPSVIISLGSPFEKIKDPDAVSIEAYSKLIIIAKALNEGWVPDWSNTSQNKYVPWFKHKSGFGLSYYDCDDWTSVTTVGSRLCFKSAELATYAATQFADIYNDYLSIK